MLSECRVYVWKEWRDHRTGVLGLTFLVLFLGVISVCLLPDGALQKAAPGIVHFLTLGILATTVVLFAPDLVRNEINRKTLGFLLRTPGGQHRAFWAKIAFLLAVMVSLTALAYATAHAVRFLRLSGEWGHFISLLYPRMLAAGSLALSLAFWFVAISCWLPRSVLTIPATALLFILVLLPCYLQFSAHPVLLGSVPLGWVHAVHPVAALIVAWFSFVRGRRAGGGEWSSAWRGLAATGIACVPLWGYAGYWAHEFYTPDPTKPMSVYTSYMGADGHHVFLNTRRHARRGNKWPMNALRVDVRSGAWETIGEPDRYLLANHTLDGHTEWQFGPHSMLSQTDSFDHYDYIDGATGARLGSSHRNIPYLDLIEPARAAKRLNTPMRLPDGRRVWLFRRRLEAETPDGGHVELPWDTRDRAHSVAGFGIRIGRKKGFSNYDLTRQRHYDRKFAYDNCWVLRDRWLIADTDPLRVKNGRHRRIDWRLLDPDEGSEQPAPGMLDGDRVCAVLDDGRVLVKPPGDAPQRVMAVDPETGSRVAVPFEVEFPLPDDPRGRDWSLRDATSFAPARGPEGRRLFLLYRSTDTGRRTYVTTLVPGSTAFTRAIRVGWVIGCPDDRTLLALDRDMARIERIDLISGDRETVFPRP